MGGHLVFNIEMRLYQSGRWCPSPCQFSLCAFYRFLRACKIHIQRWYRR